MDLPRLGPLVTPTPGDRTQAIAEHGLILRVACGSEVHGTSIGAQSDQDEMGVCIAPPESVLGLTPFEHYQFRTQPDGATSGPGDLDLIVYGLRKYVRLAAGGNPTVLLPLFVTDEHVRWIDELGHELRASRALLLSRRAGAKFRGYLDSQRRGLMGLRAGARNKGRADIRERYGFDAKFAAHMVRLGLQGVELLTTGAITLPVPEPDGQWLRDLRRGRHSKQDALDRAAELEASLDALLAAPTSPLPAEPDAAALDRWLVSMHQRHWARRRRFD